MKTRMCRRLWKRTSSDRRLTRPSLPTWLSTFLDTLTGTLMVPTILFFVLGLVAAFVRSDLYIPEGAAKFMSLYLLLAIGFGWGWIFIVLGKFVVFVVVSASSQSVALLLR